MSGKWPDVGEERQDSFLIENLASLLPAARGCLR